MKYTCLLFLIIILLFTLTSCEKNNGSNNQNNLLNSNQASTSTKITQSSIVTTSNKSDQSLKSTSSVEDLKKRINNTDSYNKLITKSIDINDFTFFVQEYVAKSYYSKNISIEEFNSRYHIECLRKLRDNVLYSVHKVNQGGLVYVLFAGRDSINSYNLINWFYVKKPLEYKDFESIKKGYSTINNIASVDSSTSVYKKTIDEYSKSYSLDRIYSIHYLIDGVLIYTYKIENNIYVVDKIEYFKDYNLNMGFSSGGFDTKIFEMDFLK